MKTSGWNLGKLGAGLLCLTALAIGAPAQATTVIDPNFAICTATTNDACGNHPNLIDAGSGSFNAFTFGGAGAGPLDPFLILLAVPNDGTSIGDAPTFTNVASNVTVSPASDPLIYTSGTTVNAGGYLGELTTSTPVNCDDLYCFAGLIDGNSSESFASFNSSSNGGPGPEEQLLGYLPSRYSIYAFVVDVNGHTNGTNLGNNTLYNIPYFGMESGTFVAAYGIECYPLDKQCNHVYDSAFTVSGWASSSGGPPTSGFAPEPGTIALLGLGLAALGVRYRRRAN